MAYERGTSWLVPKYPQSAANVAFGKEAGGYTRTEVSATAWLRRCLRSLARRTDVGSPDGHNVAQGHFISGIEIPDIDLEAISV